MANWIYKIDISGDWRNYEQGLITVEQLKKNVSNKLRIQSSKIKEEDYKEELLEISQEMFDVDNDIDEFDGVMESLYNWGDTLVAPRDGIDNPHISTRLAWIKTKF